ncbi:VOC family protein [Aquihabitans sp. McL0605]|uniref:VOC family protein n=1 Tax=Aquihabitans sp. McL0605 TaxID=3415671 RepID=UPI003CF2EED3
MKVRVHHVHLFASDLDASIAFYQRWFHGEVLADEVYAGARNVMMAIGDGRLNFYDQAPRDHGRNAVHHIGIQTDDLPQLIDQMTAGGIEFRKPITGTPGVGYVMAEGPDGVLLELFEAHEDQLTGGPRDWFAW